MRAAGAAVALLGVLGIIVVVLFVTGIGGGVPVGGEGWTGIEGNRFAGSGPLIGDEDLLEQARDYLHDHDDADDSLDEYTRALWAGSIDGRRTVVLQRGKVFAAVSLGAGEPLISPASLTG